jgi:hypothetical protein
MPNATVRIWTNWDVVKSAVVKGELKVAELTPIGGGNETSMVLAL